MRMYAGIYVASVTDISLDFNTIWILGFNGL